MKTPEGRCSVGYGFWGGFFFCFCVFGVNHLLLEEGFSFESICFRAGDLLRWSRPEDLNPELPCNIVAMHDKIHSNKFCHFLFSVLLLPVPLSPISSLLFAYFPIPASISSKDTNSSSDIVFEIFSLQRAQWYVPSLNITYRDTSKPLLLLIYPRIIETELSLLRNRKLDLKMIEFYTKNARDG
jgi:hypothetical protein